jgi:four helix bundle protein
MNIAEGCGKSSDADFARFLDMSSGSASELDYQLLLAKDLGLLALGDHKELSEQLTHIRKMLTSLIQTVRSKQPTA